MKRRLALPAEAEQPVIFAVDCKSNGLAVIISLLTIALLSGCMSQYTEPYGYVSSNFANSRKERTHILMPKGAPSISQGYKLETTNLSTSSNPQGHEGIDILAPKGTPILAPASGIVKERSFDVLFGNRIVLSHGAGSDGRLMQSIFCHLDSISVQVEDRVERGRQIGTLGRTGLLSGGFSHLHFELRRGLSRSEKFFPVNPHAFWANGKNIVTCFDKQIKWNEKPFSITYPVPCRGIDWSQ